MACLAPLAWLAGASAALADSPIKVAGQMLVDLNYTRGLESDFDGFVTSWTNYGVLGGSFVEPANSPYGMTMNTIMPPYLTYDKGGEGINVADSGGARALVSEVATPVELQGGRPFSVEVWFWKNVDAADARGLFSWTENAPVDGGDAGRFTAGNPAASHATGKNLNWAEVPAAETWHHGVLTYDGTTEKLYLNGAEQASAARALNISGATYFPMLFSGIASSTPTNTSVSLNGAIGAVRLHSEALSAADVATNHNAGMAAVPVLDVAVQGLAAVNVTTTSATLNGNVFATTDPASTALTFFYGTADAGNSSDGWEHSVELPAPNAEGSFSTNVVGLQSDTTYYFRIRGVNSNGEGWSSPVDFHTPGPPRLANLPPSLGHPGEATVSANLDPNGFATSVKLYWGPVDGGASPAGWANEVDLGEQEAGVVDVDLSGLAGGRTTYYYTFFASNSEGDTFAAPSRSFTTREIPATEDLLFSAITEVLPESGAAGRWSTYLPADQELVPINAPTVKRFGGVKWIRNLATTSTGFRLEDPAVPGGAFNSPIPVNGASVVVPVRPLPRIGSDNWDSVVDIFYNRLVLGVRNHTGQVSVWRNGELQESVATIPVGETTILTLVVQPTGEYQVWADGEEIMNVTTTSDLTALVPGVPGPFANFINVGRNNPDPWPVFNGFIGDVFVYKKALDESERMQLEADLVAKFVTEATLTFDIVASAGANGSISPAGTESVLQGTDRTYTIQADSGFVVEDVVVDGVSIGPVLTYTFTDISAPHTISASFINVPPQTITASAGANGSISPEGTLQVDAGSTQTFRFLPDTGYRIEDVVVDGVSVGAPSSYTFTFVTEPHTIAVSFSAIGIDIPRTEELLLSALTSDLVPADGEQAGNWSTFIPSANLTMMGTPFVEVIDDIKWVRNSSFTGDGFLYGDQYTAPIPVTGVTAVVAARRGTPMNDNNWDSIIDVFYNRLMLGIDDITGHVNIFVNGVLTRSTTVVPVDEAVVLVLRVQEDGTWIVRANGEDIMSGTAPAMTELDPLWNNGAPSFGSYINIGRNNPDGWTTYDGSIGDVFVYKTALEQPDLEQLEGLLMERFDATVTLDPFSGWISQFGLTAGTAKEDDPDGDGQNNLREFALDGNPTTGVASGKVGSWLQDLGTEPDEDWALVLTFPVRDGATFAGALEKSATIDGITYVIEGSNDLADDQEVLEIPALAEGMPPLSPGWNYRSFRLAGSIGGDSSRGPRGFLNLRTESAQ